MSFYVRISDKTLHNLDKVVRSFDNKTFPPDHEIFDGFAKLVSNPPAYNPLTHTLENDGYDIVGDTAIEKFKLIECSAKNRDYRIEGMFLDVSRHIANEADLRLMKLGFINRHDAFMFAPANNSEVTKVKKWMDDCYKALLSKKSAFNPADGPIDLQAAIAELPQLT